MRDKSAYEFSTLEDKEIGLKDPLDTWKTIYNFEFNHLKRHGVGCQYAGSKPNLRRLSVSFFDQFSLTQMRTKSNCPDGSASDACSQNTIEDEEVAIENRQTTTTIDLEFLAVGQTTWHAKSNVESTVRTYVEKHFAQEFYSLNNSMVV